MAQSGMEGGMTEGYERLDELLGGGAVAGQPGCREWQRREQRTEARWPRRMCRLWTPSGSLITRRRLSSAPMWIPSCSGNGSDRGN